MLHDIYVTAMFPVPLIRTHILFHSPPICVDDMQYWRSPVVASGLKGIVLTHNIIVQFFVWWLVSCKQSIKSYVLKTCIRHSYRFINLQIHLKEIILNMMYIMYTHEITSIEFACYSLREPYILLPKLGFNAFNKCNFC